jgi:hypothetical protein
LKEGCTTEKKKRQQRMFEKRKKKNVEAPCARVKKSNSGASELKLLEFERASSDCPRRSDQFKSTNFGSF